MIGWLECKDPTTINAGEFGTVQYRIPGRSGFADAGFGLCAKSRGFIECYKRGRRQESCRHSLNFISTQHIGLLAVPHFPRHIHTQ